MCFQWVSIIPQCSRSAGGSHDYAGSHDCTGTHDWTGSQFDNDLLPVSLFKVYKYHGDEHEHSTRHSTHPICPIVNTEISAHKFPVLGAKSLDESK